VDNAGRSDNRERLNKLIGEKTATRPGTHWIDHLSAAGVPCGEINSIDQVFANPQVQHLGIAADLDTIPFGPTQFVAQPMVLERTPSRMVRRPPERGEHNDEILRDLGYGPEEIADFGKGNVI
jgi:formyl-CoA transferase